MSANQGKQAELSARNQDRYRKLIKIREIIEKLNGHILDGIKLTNTQVRAAEILLRKVQPDLLATAISDDRTSALPVLQIVRGDPAKGSSALPRSKVVSAPDLADPGPGSADTAA